MRSFARGDRKKSGRVEAFNDSDMIMELDLHGANSHQQHSNGSSDEGDDNALFQVGNFADHRGIDDDDEDAANDIRSDGTGRFGRHPQSDFSVERLDERGRRRSADVDVRHSTNKASAQRMGGSVDEEWKAKYLALKEEYDHLEYDFNCLSRETEHEVTALKQELQEKDNVILRLREELIAAKQQRSGHGPSNDKLTPRAAERKIEEQNEEIQGLLEQRIALEAELAELRYANASGTPNGVPFVGGTLDGDAARTINNLRAEIREKEQHVESLQKDLAVARSEILKLGGVITVVADQAQKDEKKKKKSWFGSKKKKGKLTAAELEALAADASAVVDILEDSDEDYDDNRSVLVGSVLPSRDLSGIALKVPPAGGAHQGGTPTKTTIIQGAPQKRLIELERENARLEGEIGILGREKAKLLERVNLAEAQVDILQKTIKVDAERKKFVEVAKSVSVPVPEGGGSEADQLKCLVQLHAGALEKLACRNEQLMQTVDSFHQQGMRYSPTTPTAEEALRQQLDSRANEINTLRARLTAAKKEIATLRMNLTAFENEVNRLKQSAFDTQSANGVAMKKVKTQADGYALMIGNLIKRNATLQAELANLRRTRVNDFIGYQGEVRVLREGRATRLDGAAPNSMLFPSTNPAPVGTPVVLPLRGPVHEQPIQYMLPEPEEDPPLDSPPRQPTPDYDDDFNGAILDERMMGDEMNTRPPGAYAYKWTASGYMLQPESLESDHGAHTPGLTPQSVRVPQSVRSLRPVVTVEPLNHSGVPQNPFPVDRGLHGGGASPEEAATERIGDFPEINDGDRALAQTALKEWFKNPDFGRAVPSSPIYKAGGGQRPIVIGEPQKLEPRSRRTRKHTTSQPENTNIVREHRLREHRLQEQRLREHALALAELEHSFHERAGTPVERLRRISSTPVQSSFGSSDHGRGNKLSSPGRLSYIGPYDETRSTGGCEDLPREQLDQPVKLERRHSHAPLRTQSAGGGAHRMADALRGDRSGHVEYAGELERQANVHYDQSLDENRQPHPKTSTEAAYPLAGTPRLPSESQNNNSNNKLNSSSLENGNNYNSSFVDVYDPYPTVEVLLPSADESSSNILGSRPVLSENCVAETTPFTSKDFFPDSAEATPVVPNDLRRPVARFPSSADAASFLGDSRYSSSAEQAPKYDSSFDLDFKHDLGEPTIHNENRHSRRLIQRNSLEFRRDHSVTCPPPVATTS